MVATKIKADWNRAADPPVVGPVWVGMAPRGAGSGGGQVLANTL